MTILESDTQTFCDLKEFICLSLWDQNVFSRLCCIDILIDDYIMTLRIIMDDSGGDIWL